MPDFSAIDFYKDTSIIDDPYPYFDWLRQQGPVHRLKGRDVVAITGFEEAIKPASRKRSKCLWTPSIFPT